MASSNRALRRKVEWAVQRHWYEKIRHGHGYGTTVFTDVEPNRERFISECTDFLASRSVAPSEAESIVLAVLRQLPEARWGTHGQDAVTLHTSDVDWLNTEMGMVASYDEHIGLDLNQATIAVFEKAVRS